MRRITRYLATVFYKPLLVKYLSKERPYSYKSIQLRIHPEVFHPGYFHSTRILLNCMESLHLQGKKLLELGAGSGLISITAAKAGADVTATDINPVAMRYLQQNMASNHVDLTVIVSDLFMMIPRQVFDVVVINPPYYFDSPADFKAHAWYCGKNGEYFHSLFASLSNYTNSNTVILMVLCEGSNRQQIQSIAGEYGFEFKCMKEVQNLIERNYVYSIRQIPVITEVLAEAR
jgi:release factor glutamine methyltransferase